MKITKIIIKNFQQFQNFELDFTYPIGHPKAGLPLDKVCFIGSNGTGKTTLLNSLYYFFKGTLNNEKIIIKFLSHDKEYYYCNGDIYDVSITENENWIDIIHRYNNPILSDRNSPRKYLEYAGFTHLVQEKTDLVIYSPSESYNSFQGTFDMPNTNLNEALKRFNSKNTIHHIVNSDTIKDFWAELIYLVKKRESDYESFQNLPDNQEKTVGQVKKLFNKSNPLILEELATLWDKILDKAGLEFDAESASIPIQLNENLKAYIKLKNGNRLSIGYGQLSDGIRNFIFRVGHIYALYFNNNIHNAILLMDEPENNLYPDFLYDIVQIYCDITKNTQVFMATHSPIVAAQFEPEERIILSFEQDGIVTARKGTTPTGDDPNDMLVRDFGVRNIMGKKGVEMWERYLELHSRIKSEKDQLQKEALIDEFMKIGFDYNFSLK